MIYKVLAPSKRWWKPLGFLNPVGDDHESSLPKTLTCSLFRNGPLWLRWLLFLHSKGDGGENFRRASGPETGGVGKISFLLKLPTWHGFLLFFGECRCCNACLIFSNVVANALLLKSSYPTSIDFTMLVCRRPLIDLRSKHGMKWNSAGCRFKKKTRISWSPLLMEETPRPTTWDV